MAAPYSTYLAFTIMIVRAISQRFANANEDFWLMTLTAASWADPEWQRLRDRVARLVSDQTECYSVYEGADAKLLTYAETAPDAIPSNGSNFCNRLSMSFSNVSTRHYR